jgi:hypothetical protein
MGHRDYSNSGFSSVRNQRNIMAFVGNGFDIQVAQDFGAPIATRYTNFYHFLRLRAFNEQNVIVREMERLLEADSENWSDVESVVERLLADTFVRADLLSESLRELQGEFSEFLTLAVPSALLSQLGAASVDENLAVNSLSKFLGDLAPDAYRQARFPATIDHYDLYNFLFVNFNYTSLLDDLVYLDQNQFDPLPYRTVDRNFSFNGNPAGVDAAAVRPDDTYSSYVMTEVVHPHGHHGIPRSILFGIDEPTHKSGNQDRILRLSKPFWAQNERRYKHLFHDTELFIVFGCSLGESDRWWWRHIAESLGMIRERPGGKGVYQPELILYWYNGGNQVLDEAEVRQRFLAAAGVSGGKDLTDSIHVVLHDSSTPRFWLNTSRT